MRNGALATEKIADRTQRDLVDILRTLEMSIRRTLAKLNSKQGKLESDVESLNTANEVRREIVATLKKLGVKAVEDLTLARAIEAVAEEVKTLRVSPDVAVPVMPQAAIEQIVSGMTHEISLVFKEASDEVRIAINRGITTNSDLVDVIDKVSERLSIRVGQAATLVDAAVMAAGRRAIVSSARAANKTKAKIDGQELSEFVYMLIGPDDEKTRPFCRKWLNKAVTQDKLDSLDNGQLNPVADFCGGYNCRHSWVPMPRAEAEGLGLKVYS
jgi:hypothetical protein